jgi:hypothetical protein
VSGRAKFLLGAGAAASPLAWFAVQQVAGGLTYFTCEHATPPGVVLAVLGLLACASAAVVVWPSRLASEPTARFAAQLGLGLAAIFGLANLVTLAAIVLIPPCAR